MVHVLVDSGWQSRIQRTGGPKQQKLILTVVETRSAKAGLVSGEASPWLVDGRLLLVFSPGLLL